MSSHAEHSHPALDSEEYLREVARQCLERGLRLTDLRLQVLTLLARAGRPVKAYELLDLLRLERSGAAPPTVYRALDFLLEHGFIHKLESINAFVSCHHLDHSHSGPFLICDACDATIELDDGGVNQRLREQAAAVGFVPQTQTVEVHGVCASCRDGGGEDPPI